VSIRVLIFDDVFFARGEQFHIPGLDADLYEHADDAVELVAAIEPAYIFMDFAMGGERDNGAEAIARLRASGYRGVIVAMSSDPALNDAMVEAGADERLAKKALLRSFLMDLGSKG
jgi:DNA-binding NarL/FixJ family response regulator